jgi:copper chaperone
MEGKIMKKKILIEGMSCQHCVGHVKEALEGLDKVTSIDVSLENNWAIVETTNSNEELKAVIEEEGYDVINIEE